MSYIDETELLGLLREVKKAYTEKDYERAYKNAQTVLNIDPFNSYALKIEKLAVKQVIYARKKEFKRRKKELKTLWDSRNFELLLEKYRELEKFYPNSFLTKLTVKYLKQKALKEKIIKSRKIKKNLISKVNSFRKTREYLEAIKVIKDNFINFSGEQWVADLLQKIKHEHVDHELKKRNFYLDSGEYENLYRFLAKLYKLFPEKKILDHIRRAEALIIEKRKYDNKIFTNESLELINTLYNTGKFEECMQTCEELFQHSGKTLQGKYFYKKAKNSNEKEMNQIIDKKLLNIEKSSEWDNKESYARI